MRCDCGRVVVLFDGPPEAIEFGRLPAQIVAVLERCSHEEDE